MASVRAMAHKGPMILELTRAVVQWGRCGVHQCLGFLEAKFMRAYASRAQVILYANSWEYTIAGVRAFRGLSLPSLLGFRLGCFIIFKVAACYSLGAVRFMLARV